ncbi:hypothetical protein [Streptomyces sp. NPDC047108]|uniref:hypothetical protein n=1 Tax=Streptomyces sp. NPDC047108 TaxID=3155025 RepID=UPI0033EFBF0B
MSQPWQQQPQSQPQQPGNPFAQQQPGAYPPPPAPVRRGNVGLAVVLGIVAALVAAGIYAGVLYATFDEDKGEVTQIGYLAVGVGALIGFALGKFGGNNVALQILGAVLGVVAVVLGELYGYALIMAEYFPGAPAATEIFFDNFSRLFDGWKEDLDAISYLFFALAAAAGFSVAKKSGS